MFILFPLKEIRRKLRAFDLAGNELCSESTSVGILLRDIIESGASEKGPDDADGGDAEEGKGEQSKRQDETGRAADVLEQD